MYGLYQIKASAGSGKTHFLTRLFLQLLQEKNPLESILAITFTNAAAGEMRSRILSHLKRIALGFEKNPGLTQEMAKHLLETILYNFSSLNVRTIDSLLMQLVRTAALTLKLNPDFEPVFSTEKTLNPYLEILASRARAGDCELAENIRDITSTLYLEYNSSGFLALDKIQKRLIPIFSDILLQNVNEVTERSVIKNLYSKSRDVLTNALTSLVATQETLAWNKTAANSLNNALSLEKLNEIAYLRKDHTVENLFKKDTKIPDSVRHLFATIQEEKDRYLLLKDAAKTIPFVDFGKAMVNAFLTDDNAAFYLHTETIPPLVRSIFENILPAQDSFITKVSAIQHTLIDEFQDTSDTQWMALEPLFQESLARHGSLTFVGDLKQSIFSFRGGNPALFDDILNPKISKLAKNVEEQHIKKEKLPYNWRSCKEIINFTNTFYKPLTDPTKTRAIVDNALSKDFPDSYAQEISKTICNTFADLTQEFPKDKDDSIPGYINLRESSENYIDELIELVQSIHNDRPWSDMLILLRKNEACQELAGEMSRHDIPVVTENSLLLSQSPLVIETIAFLRYLAFADELAFFTVVSGSIFQQPKTKGQFSEEVFCDALQKKEEKQGLAEVFQNLWPNLWEEFFSPFLSQTTYFSAYDLVCEWYSYMQLEERFPDARVFLRRLLEILHASEKETGGSITNFLEFWESCKDSEKVPMPEQMDAVRIMTIHKAKGLEAPIVLFPWKMQQVKVEQTLHIEPFENNNQKYSLPAFLSNRYEKYYTEYMHTFCEQFNLLYVATTRACEALYILRIPIRYDKKDILKNLAEASGIAIPSELGTLPRKSKPQQTQSEDIPFTPKPHTTPWHPMQWLPKLKIAKTNPNEEAERAKEMGWLVHECLQFVRYQDDIGKTCEDALQFVLTYHTPKYPVTKPMQKKIKTSLQWFLQQEQSRTWLANGWREQILMQEDGSLARCDLLVPTNDTWLVIDYRSGRANRTHQREIKKFCDLLTKKGISCMGVLVYLDRQCFQVINGTKLSECQRTFQQCLA